MARLSMIAMASALALAATHTTATADEGIELGGFFGYHIFNDKNALAVTATGGDPASGFALGARVGFGFTSRLTAEGEVVAVPTEAGDGSELGYYSLRLAGLWHFLDGRVKPFATLGVGLQLGAPADGDTDIDSLWYAGGGVKYGIGPTWGVRGDARILFPPKLGEGAVTTDFEVLVGVYKVFEIGGEEEPPPPPPPPAPTDSDGDGIMNEDDRCPTDAEDADGFEDADGCPDLDNDGDGIEDASDGCPTAAEDVDQFEDADGCPDVDNDGDGIEDAKDQCINEAEDMDGFEDADGCPDLDNDGDGVSDANDKCPTELETANGYEDTDGCPDELPKEVAKYTGTIEGIVFRKDSAVIQRRSFKVLDRALVVLLKYPELKLEIAGHTDTTGTREHNLELSQARADAVKEYFTSKGVDPSRLEAVGYGPDKPVADNDTSRGRKKNRRVEFNLKPQNQ